MDVHIAAGILCIQLGIQHFGRSGALHIVQVDDPGHGSTQPAAAVGYAAVGHDGSNGVSGGSVHHHAGLFFFLTAFLQLAALPGIFGYRPVDQVGIVGFQPAVCLDLVAAAPLRCHLAVIDQSGGIAADLIVGTCDANGGCRRFASQGRRQHPGVVGDGLVAPGHHAHVPCTVDVCLYNFRRGVVFDIVVAAGTAHRHGSFQGAGSAHGHAGNIAFGIRADIQVAHVHGGGALFICIGYACGRRVLDPVHAYRHHAGQEGFIPGKLQGRRPGVQGGGSVCFHGNQRGLAAAVLVDSSILQASRVVLENVGVRPDALGANQRFFGNAHTHRHRGGLGHIRSRCADSRGRVVLLNRGNVCVVNFRPEGLPAVARIGALIAFRQGHADAQRYRRILNGQLRRSGNGRLAGLVRSCRFYGRRITDRIPFRCGRIRIPVLVFPHDGNRIVMAPVYAKVTVGRHGAVILIGSRRPQGQGQGIGVVLCV